MNSSYAIEARGLSKSFGERHAVTDSDLRIARGEITGFVGPNGAGKTTTIRMLLRLIAPSAGSAEVLGEPITGPGAYLSRVGALIESPAFYPGLSGRANLEVLQRLGRLDRGRIDLCLDSVDLVDRAGDRAKEYSLGMKQRLAIAGALLPDPELLILDEPTNGLDPAGIREMRVLLKKLAGEGVSILVSSHLLTEVEAICDQLAVIREGRLVYQGSVRRLLEKDQGRIALRSQHEENLPDLLRIGQGLGYEATLEGDLVIVAAPASAAAEINRFAFDEGIVLTELRPTEASLEDAFFDLEGQREEVR